MKIKLPIVGISEKEAWEKGNLERNIEHHVDKMKEMGILSNDAPQIVPFENQHDRFLQFLIDFEDINLFYETYVYFNDDELEGVRVKMYSGYWPPVFAVPFTVFQKIYVAHEKGVFVEHENKVIIDYEEAIEIVQSSHL